MSGWVSVLGMSALLGVGSFAIGMLPLSFTFSRPTLAKLTTFGTGLLLGTALGVIIPEGVETVASGEESHRFPTHTVAIALLSGFKFMLLVERIISARSQSHSHTHVPLPTSESSLEPPRSATNGYVEFDADVELGELEREQGIAPEIDHRPSEHRHIHHQDLDSDGKKKAYPLTLGLVVHALADGLALGSSALANDSAVPSGLSVVIFVALLIHKAPTALALATSLLSTSLSRADCRKHLAVFSASTPIGAITTYGIMTLLRVQSDSTWSGFALLFSGGSFLYVATVLQPGKASSEDISNRLRFLLTILGFKRSLKYKRSLKCSSAN